MTVNICDVLKCLYYHNIISFFLYKKYYKSLIIQLLCLFNHLTVAFSTELLQQIGIKVQKKKFFFNCKQYFKTLWDATYLSCVFKDILAFLCFILKQCALTVWGVF